MTADDLATLVRRWAARPPRRSAETARRAVLAALPAGRRSRSLALRALLALGPAAAGIWVAFDTRPSAAPPSVPAVTAAEVARHLLVVPLRSGTVLYVDLDSIEGRP